MRTHTTLTLRTLIVNEMDTAKYKMTKHEIGIWLETLPEITNEMFEAIYFFTHGLFQIKLVSRQIRQIQQECIYLLDIVDKYQNLPSTMSALKSAAIKCLDLIIERIESDCSNYLKDDIQMPAMYLRRELVSVESQMKLVEALLKNLDTDPGLLKLVLECMTDLLKSPRCCYSRMNYVKKLQDSLIVLCKQSDKRYINKQLTDHLIATNYNTAGFIKYYQQKINDDLAALIEEKEQFLYLYDYEKEFNNYPYRKSSVCYDVKRKKVKHILTEFIQSELSIRRKKAALNVPEPVQIVQSPVIAGLKPPLANYKIRTALSVDALAYFVKLMISAKVIEPGVRTELMAFIARSFQTPGTGIAGISPASLETKYKQVVQTTAKTLKTLLMRMLKILNEEFEIG